jgi:hypothetical protein
MGPHFPYKIKVSCFVVKLCPYQRLNQNSSSIKFEKFELSIPEIWICKYKHSFLRILLYAWIFWKHYISGMLSSKILKLCGWATLVEALIWAKFHDKTRNFAFIGKMGFHKQILVKSRYLSQISADAHILLGFL